MTPYLLVVMLSIKVCIDIEWKFHLYINGSKQISIRLYSSPHKVLPTWTGIIA